MNPLLRHFQRIHLVGIGGTGMSGIAEVLLTLGFSVSGSDVKRSAVTERLEQLGARIFVGHRAEHVAGAHVVVASSAIPPDNVELVEAQRQKIPVIPRAEMLAELMRLKYGIAVAGAHGKTTTTSLVATVLAAAGLDPTFVVGGRVKQAGAPARVGQSDYMVVEADESDRSLLLLSPVVTVITNIDREHLDHYGTLEAIQETFAEFANRVPFYGLAVLCMDDPNIRAILPRLRRPALTYGTTPQADLVISDVRLLGEASEFSLSLRGRSFGAFRLPTPPGLHNVRNAAAAAAVGFYLGLTPDQIRQGLASFQGVARRFEVRAVIHGVTLVDDYGHHPTEIRATLEAARQCGFRRLLVCFQPHRYSRTQLLWKDFTGAFDLADRLVVTDVYPAGEQPIEGVHSARLAEAIAAGGHRGVWYCPTPAEGIRQLAGMAQPGDALLAIGAGNVGQALEVAVEELSRKASVHATE